MQLPCDIGPPDGNDTTEMVLWYKDEMETPIFRVDRRRHDSGRYVRPDFSRRLTFTPTRLDKAQNRIAHLNIINVKTKDAGVYRCRVDYEMHRTRNTKIYLSIISKYP